jgi:hypothetical protein
MTIFIAASEFELTTLSALREVAEGGAHLDREIDRFFAYFPRTLPQPRIGRKNSSPSA